MSEPNLNREHGASRVLIIGDMHDTSWAKKFLDDIESLEIVYVAEETFEDGYRTTNVCYRVAPPVDKMAVQTKKPVKQPQPTTLIRRIT